MKLEITYKTVVPSGTSGVTGDAVDNTDPSNPVVNAIPYDASLQTQPIQGTYDVDPTAGELHLITGAVYNSGVNLQDGGISLSVEEPGLGDSGVVVNSTTSSLQTTDGSSSGIIETQAEKATAVVSAGAVQTRIDVEIDTVTINSNDPAFPGAEYIADFSANYTSRSLVDKEYVDTAVSGGGTAPIWYRGDFDASGGAYPSAGSGSGVAGAIESGDTWRISVAGTLPTGVIVGVGDEIVALVDAATNSGADWNARQGNLPYTAENVANKVGTVAASATDYPTNNAVIAYAGGRKYTREIQSTTTNPPDSVTRYFGAGAGQAMSATGGVRRIYTPIARTITAVELDVFLTVNGSSELVEFYVRVNNTTDYAISTTVTLDSGANTYTRVVNTSLAIALAAGDYFEIKMVTPAWVTNPTGVVITGVVEMS